MSNATDFTRMELGRVTRIWRGKRVAVIAVCRKCGKRGSRTATFPDSKTDWRGKPYVHVTHRSEVKDTGFGFRYIHELEGCSTLIDRTNVDDLLNVPERKEYDAFVQAIRETLGRYAD